MSVKPLPFLLRTAHNVPALCRSMGYGDSRVARFRRRSDRTLPAVPQHGHEAAGIAEGAAHGPQLSAPLDPSPEPSHERIGSLIAGSIVFATGDARKVG